MRPALQTPPPGFDELTADEQVDYVQALWDRIAAREDQVSVPGWHRAELSRRLADHQADPEAGRPWSEIEAELRAHLTRR
ncbi:MAG TPA: addiction module protein [Candidatus Nanopelagicales bacterium]|nr:addiction module protein [Candidatus Nanopelagicales bacterium]